LGATSKILDKILATDDVWYNHFETLFSRPPTLTETRDLRNQCVARWRTPQEEQAVIQVATHQYLFCVTERIGTGDTWPQNPAWDVACTQEIERLCEYTLHPDVRKLKNEGLISRNLTKKVLGSYTYVTDEEAHNLFRHILHNVKHPVCRYLGATRGWLCISTSPFLPDFMKACAIATRGGVVSTATRQSIPGILERRTWFAFTTKEAKPAQPTQGKKKSEAPKLAIDHVSLDQKVLPRYFQLLAPVHSQTPYSRHFLSAVAKLPKTAITGKNCIVSVWHHFFPFGEEEEGSWASAYRLYLRENAGVEEQSK